jgi:hypothetical protein
VYTAPLTNKEGYTLALARIDSGLALVANVAASDAFGTSIKNSLLVAKARTLVDLGQHAQAAALVTAIPTSFAWNLTFSTTAGDNGPYAMNGVGASSRYVVSDSFDFFNGQLNIVKNALPVRVGERTRDFPCPGSSTATQKAIDAYTPFVGTVVWSDRSAPVPLVTGIDARLIEAEAKLKAGDIAGMMTIMNALRTSPQKLGKLDVAAMAALARTDLSGCRGLALLQRKSILDIRTRAATRRSAPPDPAVRAHARSGIPGRQLLQERRLRRRRQPSRHRQRDHKPEFPRMP